MEGSSLLLTSSSPSSRPYISSTKLPLRFFLYCSSPPPPPPPRLSLPRATTSATLLLNHQHHPNATPSSPSSSKEFLLPKIDKSGRFCSPRAARELALSILYAACLEGSDPVRLFEKRLNARWETGYEFDKESLVQYNPMSFGGPPVTASTAAEADQLLLLDQKESEIEAEVLAAPPKLVYSKLVLRFSRKLLVAVVDKWNDHIRVIDKVAPPNWKNDPAGRILELSILHLSMSEIAVLGTRHQIVINEAVDLAKRFCDGAAPRIINGCLRSFIKQFNSSVEAAPEESESSCS
ncbi:OLC1v1007747C1 [Oldenlandia corymbosa var. corymbosa]|uniref:OLC1v1007747C1 n=1 Tax=Oldenlandia corymbosa var. corymbosa TaxID=529605 RepID=A0AAV1DKH9_OLDCO|nr:OLC1v1007747C1 [Oldenlandia corymbosa var. corymbosa]